MSPHPAPRGPARAAASLRLLAHPHDCMDICCVLDADERLVDAARAGFPKVHADTDQERVASQALHHGLSAIPVIDASGRLLGVVPPAALLHILRENLRAREAIEARTGLLIGLVLGGLTMPWLLDRLGTDPAYGSGPLATIIQDLLSLLIYFVVVGAMMS